MATDFNTTQPLLSEDAASETITEQKTITGTVKDKEGPLIGASILIKGTGTGTITDIDGVYSIDIEDDQAVLIFSYTGYSTKEVVVGDQSVINVMLETNSEVLDEVVVVGYSTRKRGELTGSVSTVNNKELERTSNKDLAKSLAGKVPGLIVSDRGGYPGSTNDITLLIRGKSTLNNNSPLILIDGITAASFSHLSPQDIESISVLKDGAAAIYGARAANGVILITTKRGKSGKPEISLTSSFNLSTLSAAPNQMTSEQHAIYNNEIAARNGTDLPYTQEDINKYAAGNDPVNYPSTDWYDLTFADYSPEWRNTLSISGGSDRVNYFVSGDYIDQVGLYESGDLKFKQYQVRSNIDIKLFENFKVGVDLSGRFGDSNEPGVERSYIYKHIYTNEPTQVGIYPNGLIGWGGENGSNPYLMSSNEAGFINRVDNNLRSKLSFDWNLGALAEGLSIQGFAGIRRWSTNTKSWYTPWEVVQYVQGSGEYVSSKGYSQQGTKSILREDFWNFNELMLNATLHYNRTFGSHTLRGFVGYEQFTSNQRNFWAERKDFPSDNHPELFAGSDEGQISSGTSAEWARLNYFGSLSYDFKKKYFIDLTLRYDGSSNFGPGKRFGTFPGVAVGWSIADEAFMEGTDGWLDALKIRASWALMGNDRINAFQYLTRYNYGGNTDVAQPNYYIFGMPGIRYNGYTSANVPNPDITWETADMKNIGLNFAMLNYRLTADINYFYQKREDILITRNASIPDAAGITLPQENLGKVNNFGWELQLGWNDKKGDDFTYNFGANLTQAKNEVVYLDEATDVPEGMRREGFSMDSYVVYPTAGIFQDQAQVEATAVKKEGTVEGEPIYLDTNSDGVIDSKDRIRVHSSNVPEIQYGIFGGFSYKGFDFNVLFQGQAKAEMFVFFDQQGAKPEYVFTERWTPENRDSRYPRAFMPGDPYSGLENSDLPEAADLYLHDASFLKLREVELGYNFSKDQIKFGNLRVYIRGYNLLTMFSEVYDLGLDPEATGYNNFRDSTYPSLKSYSVGLNLTF